MTKINLSLDYNRNDGEYDKMSDAELSINYITYAVGRKYADGLEGQKRRVWGRIQRKFDDISKKGEVDLEDAEVRFIRGVFTEDLKFPAMDSKLIVVLEDEIERMYTDHKKRDK